MVKPHIIHVSNVARCILITAIVRYVLFSAVINPPSEHIAGWWQVHGPCSAVFHQGAGTVASKMITMTVIHLFFFSYNQIVSTVF